MKRMLFNATHAEETRVGIVDGQKLIDIDIETAGREARKSNIYKAIVTRIEPSLEACFVNYGEERHGFLPFKEISRQYFKEGVDPRNASIRDAISEGQELIVQVEKEERGNKGAALTTYVSLAGRYLVLMPNNPRGGGVSRRVEGEERQELREAMDKLDLPRGMSTIARTAGIGRTTEELQWDLNYLLKLWKAISGAAQPQYEYTRQVNGRNQTEITTEPTKDGRNLKRINPAPFLIVEESNLVVRAIRDYFQPEIKEILVDTDEIYEQARQFMAHVMPDMIGRVKRYREDIPIFTRFQIEHQLETAYSRTVPLPSGGAIVIDHTEALVAIDVNSARSTRGSDIEETAFRTNCEAADEVARQMRLRDLGGLIVIDFIDMVDTKNQRAVEQRLKDALRYDRARVQMGKISRFGLMELSRQRLRPSLSEGNHITCPRCNGVGVIRDTESCALQVLRILQEECLKEHTGSVLAQVPVDVATYLLNEKRNDITKLEARHCVRILLVPNPHLETPHFDIQRVREDDESFDADLSSYKRVEEIDTSSSDDPYAQKRQEDKPQRPRQVPVIKNVLPDPAPVHVEKAAKPAEPVKDEVKAAEPARKGFFRRLFDFFLGSSDETDAVKEDEKKKDEDDKDKQRGRGGRSRSRRDGLKSRRGDRRGDRRKPHAEGEVKDDEEESTEERKDRRRGSKKPGAELASNNKPAKNVRTRRRRKPAEERDEAGADVNEVHDNRYERDENAAPAGEAPKSRDRRSDRNERRSERNERNGRDDRRQADADDEQAVTADANVSEEENARNENAARPEDGDKEQTGETRRRRPRRRRRSPKNAEKQENAAENQDGAADDVNAGQDDKSEKSEQAEKVESPEKVETEVKDDKAEKSEKAEKPSRAERNDKQDRPARGRRSERPARAAQQQASDSGLVQVETVSDAKAVEEAYSAPEPVGRKIEPAPVEKPVELEQVETVDASEDNGSVERYVSHLAAESAEASSRRGRRAKKERKPVAVKAAEDDEIHTSVRPLAQAVSGVVAKGLAPAAEAAEPAEVKPAAPAPIEVLLGDEPTDAAGNFEFLVKATARALVEQPWMNWSFRNDREAFAAAVDELEYAWWRLGFDISPFNANRAVFAATPLALEFLVKNVEAAPVEAARPAAELDVCALYESILETYGSERKKSLIAANYGFTDYKLLAMLDSFEFKPRTAKLKTSRADVVVGVEALDWMLMETTPRVYSTVQTFKRKHPKTKKAEWQLRRQPVLFPSAREYDFEDSALDVEARRKLLIRVFEQLFLESAGADAEQFARDVRAAFDAWAAHPEQTGVKTFDVFFDEAARAALGELGYWKHPLSARTEAAQAPAGADELVEKAVALFHSVLEGRNVKVRRTASEDELPRMMAEVSRAPHEEIAVVDAAELVESEQSAEAVEAAAPAKAPVIGTSASSDEELVQVHTAAEYGTVTAYPVQVNPGRKVEERASEGDEGELVQVETDPSNRGQALYAVQVNPGRAPRETVAVEEGELVQVETSRE